MTIWQIISPNGTKVCKIQAVSRVTKDNIIYFYSHDAQGFKYDKWIAELPAGWVAINTEIIEMERTP